MCKDGTETVYVTPTRTLRYLLRNLTASYNQQGHVGSKTQQNPSMFNWGSHLIQVVLCDGHKTVLCMLCISGRLERCNPWKHVANRRISISQLLSLWRHSHYDVSRLRRSRRSQPPFSLWRHSHSDVIRYWSGHAHRYGRTYVRTDTITAFNIHRVKWHHISEVVIWSPFCGATPPYCA